MEKLFEHASDYIYKLEQITNCTKRMQLTLSRLFLFGIVLSGLQAEQPSPGSGGDISGGDISGVSGFIQIRQANSIFYR